MYRTRVEHSHSITDEPDLGIYKAIIEDFGGIRQILTFLLLNKC